MLELKCPQIESREDLCDRTAEYQVDGTIYCARHARRLIELKAAQTADLKLAQKDDVWTSDNEQQMAKLLYKRGSRLI